MKKILNETKDGVCQTITVHYHKEGVSNIIGGQYYFSNSSD